MADDDSVFVPGKFFEVVEARMEQEGNPYLAFLVDKPDGCEFGILNEREDRLPVDDISLDGLTPLIDEIAAEGDTPVAVFSGKQCRLVSFKEFRNLAYHYAVAGSA
jgi:hypothetical protein